MTGDTSRVVWGDHGPLILALVVLVVAFHIVLTTHAHVTLGMTTYWHTNDDPMITMRVAQNFFETGNPYFNQQEPVAANTSLFWPMALAVVFTVADNTLAIPVVIAASAIMSAFAILIAVSIIPSPIVRIVTAVSIALSPTFFRYGNSGWEHVPQMLLISATMVSIWNASKANDAFTVPTKALVLVSLAFLCRVDSAPSVAAVAIAWLLTQKRYRAVRSYLFLLVLCIVPVSYLGLMYSFYGDFVPNTAVLKMIDRFERLELGTLYIMRPHSSGLVPLLIVGLLLLWPPNGAGKFIVFVAALHMAFVVYLGGDIFTLGRFFMAYLPITFSLFCYVVAVRFGGRVSIAVPFLLVSAWHAPYIVDDDMRAQAVYGNSRGAQERIRAVRTVADVITPQDGSIGLHYLGTSYHVPEFHVVDFLGKAEPTIARLPPRIGHIGHNKWDYDYAFGTYNIAAVPMFDRYVSEPGDENVVTFWSEAVRALKEREYVYLTPTQIGNSEGGIGLFVRPDLRDKFEAYLQAQHCFNRSTDHVPSVCKHVVASLPEMP